MSAAKHTPVLTRDHVFAIADKYGEFEFGDAQGDKRQAFAADVIAAHQRIRDAAPDLLAALDPETLEAVADEIDCFEHSARASSLRLIAKAQLAAIAKATGEGA